MIRWHCVVLPLLLVVAATQPALAADDAFYSEAKVQKPTRLDWEFVASNLGPGAATLPRDYHSEQQRYQLYLPLNYSDKKSWPLVVFVSPGDAPLGWRSWQKVCHDEGIFFCAAYGAGSNHSSGERIRIVLDMLDDVRRQYRIDPQQTYFAGLGDGGRLASALGFALPELCGGVVLIGATPITPRLDYLRHRAEERLSVAFVAGESDFARRDLEESWFPLYRELGVRTRLWTPKTGHEPPPPETVAALQSWLAEDLPRRRKDAEARPTLTIKPEEGIGGQLQAARTLEAAQAEMVLPGRLYRAMALLQGIAVRWPKTEAAEKATALMREIEGDRRLKDVLTDQRAAEERRLLSAQARGRERAGDVRTAYGLFEKVASNHPASAEGKQAALEMKRLGAVLAALPYLGVSFEEDGVTVRAVAPNGPAQRAGLRSGDRVLKFGTATIASFADLRAALRPVKPGDRVNVEVQRNERATTLTVELAATPVP